MLILKNFKNILSTIHQLNSDRLLSQLSHIKLLIAAGSVYRFVRKVVLKEQASLLLCSLTQRGLAQLGLTQLGLTQLRLPKLALTQLSTSFAKLALTQLLRLTDLGLAPLLTMILLIYQRYLETN